MKYLILTLFLFFSCGKDKQEINVYAGNEENETVEVDNEQEQETTETSGSGGAGSGGGGGSNPWEDKIPDDYEPQPLPEPLPEPMPNNDTGLGGALSWICKILPSNPVCLVDDLSGGAVNGIVCSILPNLSMCKGGDKPNPKPEPNKPIKTCEDKIIFEAENFTSQSGYSVIDKAGASGKVIQVGDSGVAKYSLDFPKAGRWYVHIKTMAEGHTDNGLYLNLDGQRVVAPSGHPLAGKSQIWLQKGSVWSWKPKFQGGHGEAEGPVTIDIQSAGVHEFSIEKKLVERPFIDKIILATSDIDSSQLDGLKCEATQEPKPQPEPNDKLYFNIVISQTLESCNSCGIIFDWEGNQDRTPLLKINHGNGTGQELNFRDEISSISLGSNRFNNKPNVMLVKKMFDSKGFLIADISALPKGSPINTAKLCLKLHSQEGLSNDDKTSVLSVSTYSKVWDYNSSPDGGQSTSVIREIRADRDFWGQGISKANPWGCYDFTQHVTNLQNNR